jgi:hypothetical protein
VPYIQTPFLEFRELVARHIRELEKEDAPRYSGDWFFLRYLRRVHRQALRTEVPRGVDSAMRGLIRYYVDGVDAGSPLAGRFDEILRAHARACRLHRAE